jgi:putative transposase
MVSGMARKPRKVADGGIYHAINRGNGRMPIFERDGDFAAFLSILEAGRERVGMRVLGYCLMTNHWHLVLWPRRGEDLSRFIGWVSTTHVRRWREFRGTRGEGHVYQGRFKSFLVQPDGHFHTVMRYVEGNALRAGMVKRAEDWAWSSLAAGTETGGVGVDGRGLELAEWPVDRPRGWVKRVNEEVGEAILKQLAVCVARSRPFGDEAWVERTAKRFGLESSLRSPGRPRKTEDRTP